jgi:glucoamylase
MSIATPTAKEAQDGLPTVIPSKSWQSANGTDERGATAPGAPGLDAQWSSGAKTGVGTALSPASSLWFTISHGILTEVYYPFVDTACTRDMELIVTDRKQFFSEEKRDTRSEVNYLAAGIPAYRLLNSCLYGRYRIEKTILADPFRSTILQQIRFTASAGKLQDYAVFVLLSPHLNNQGTNNTAWIGEFKGLPMLFARRYGTALALACSAPWKNRSAGYVGTSDGWQDLARHRQMRWHFEQAENGNVALVGEVDLAAGQGQFLLALSFGRDESEAGHRARASLLNGFEAARATYVQQWADWHKGLLPLAGARKHPQDMYRISAMVMRTHEAKHIPGGIVASLGIPWGATTSSRSLGYHLVWPRDMIEAVGGMLAIRQHEDARRVLLYLHVTQEADGHWPQNMFLDGRPHWRGIQLDETALAILLVNMAYRYEALSPDDLATLSPMVWRAVEYLVRRGPVSPMDRWEEQAGYCASTMAIEIPALLVAADLAEMQGEKPLAFYLRETADAWNAAIDETIYVTGTDLARRMGVDGYYVRFAKPDQMIAPSPAYGEVTLANHPPGQGQFPVADIVSPDVLCLVRFGLRTAGDPRIVNTVRVIDQLLKVDTPHGPCWHRYSHDGYGEHEDGSPFDGTGIGRAWPLLTGERAHYELAAGNIDEAERLLRAMESFANESGLLPEQVWDTRDIAEQQLHFARPSGSAMPLVWAHAEYVKLRRSLHDGRVFDMPPQPVERYLVRKTESAHAVWRFEQKRRALRAGRTLRLETMAPATVRWTGDDWKSTREIKSRDTGLGVHVMDLSTATLPPGAAIAFTFYWPEARRWEGANFSVLVE